MFMDRTKPATQAEIQQWIDGAKDNYPDISNQVGRFRGVRFAEEDFILPALYGAQSVTVLVAKGVKIYRHAGMGHSLILYMDGFRMEGV